MSADRRRPVVLLTVLPKERRSRHPYQLCMMFALTTLSASQLVHGPAPASAITALSQSQQNMLNWYALWASLAGIASAIIPERIVTWRIRGVHQFDATWFRLWIEAGCHGLLFFVWMSYLVTITERVPIMDGLTLGSGLVLALAVAAVWRVSQILWTVKRAVFDPPQDSGIVGSKTIEAVLDKDDD